MLHGRAMSWGEARDRG